MNQGFWHYPSIYSETTGTIPLTNSVTQTTDTTTNQTNTITGINTTNIFNNNNNINSNGNSDKNKKQNDDNNNNDGSNSNEYNTDFSQIDYYQDHLSFIESNLSPILCILDFDHTLAVYDDQYILDEDVTDHLPSIYTRPFLYQLLDYLKSVNKNNIIILWTAGTNSYIQQSLLLLNIAQYFDHILSRKHCHESHDKFDISKSYQYLIETFPQYKNMRSVIVDNYAWRNSANSGYNKTISIKPFTLEDVVKTFGAFNVNPCDIRDIYTFIESKGKLGKEINTSHRISETYFGDTALLNLIKYLQKYFFNTTAKGSTQSQPQPQSQSQPQPQPLRLHALYSVKPNPNSNSATLQVIKDPSGSGIPIMYSIIRS